MNRSPIPKREVEGMLNLPALSGGEPDAPWTALAILSSHPNSRATANDVIALILGVDRLLVFAAPGEFVQAATHRCDPQELEVCLASSPARLEEIRDFVSFHPKCLATGQRVLG